jgi:hypothetical protein
MAVRAVLRPLLAAKLAAEEAETKAAVDRFLREYFGLQECDEHGS